MGKKHEKLVEELTENELVKIKRRKQQELQKKYAYLHTIDKKYFQYEYLLAQAKKICDMELELRLSPFKGLYSTFLQTITKDNFLENNYIVVNDYGLLEPDYERLVQLKPPKINFDNLNKVADT